LSLLNSLVKEVTKDLDNYDTVNSISKINKFINEFSTWYVRRSRDRVGASAENEEDRNAFYTTSHDVFVTLSKILAPIAPFTVEEIYKNLTGEESVHLASWPSANEMLIDKELEGEMIYARQIVEQGHALRKENQFKVRQPLASMITISPIVLSDEVLAVIGGELNIRSISNTVENGLQEAKVKTIDFNLTDELIKEGQVRDIIRQIQQERKLIGTKFDEKVDVSIPEWPREFEGEIKRKALINNLSQGEFKVSKI
jgi:isoleucyl-tRNA synthetase